MKIRFFIFSLLITASLYAQLINTLIEDKINYTPYSNKGDQIPDYSMVGYKNGVDVSLENGWSIERTLSPSVDGDDTDEIQAAIDEVSLLPLNGEGFRGSVYLQAGQYTISDTITISSSGVILEGAGDSTEILVDSTLQIDAFLINGGSKNGYKWTAITSDYVPVGSRMVEVADTTYFAVGKLIQVESGKNDKWISDLGVIPAYWNPLTFQVRYDRKIIGMSGNRLFLDVPLVDPLESQYNRGKVGLLSDTRITNVAIRNLHILSSFDETMVAYDPIYDINYYNDENHPWKAIRLDYAKDCFIYNVAASHFGYSLVHIDNNASYITVKGCRSYAPVSLCNTGSRRYTFCLDGQLNLVEDCWSEWGRHTYVQQDRTCGPNVFYNSSSYNGYDFNEAHQKWSTGALYDNIYIQGRSSLQATNRTVIGAGEHGWAGANQVFYNCSAPVIWVQNVPVAGVNNFILGVREFVHDQYLSQIHSYLDNNFPAYDPNLTGAATGDGWLENSTSALPLYSLYEQQVKDRLSDNEYNVMPNVIKFEAESYSSIDSNIELVNGADSCSNNSAVRFINTAAYGEITYNLSGVTGFTDGYYDIRICYFDENDGEADLEFYKNSELLKAITLTEDLGEDSILTTSAKTFCVIKDVKLTTLDMIKIRGRKNDYDWAVVDYIELKAADCDIMEKNYALADSIDGWSITPAVSILEQTPDGVHIVADGYDAKIYRVFYDTLPQGDYTLLVDGEIITSALTVRIREGAFGTTINSTTVSDVGEFSTTQDFTVPTTQNQWTMEVKAIRPGSDLSVKSLTIRKR